MVYCGLKLNVQHHLMSISLEQIHHVYFKQTHRFSFRIANPQKRKNLEMSIKYHRTTLLDIELLDVFGIFLGAVGYIHTTSHSVPINDSGFLLGGSSHLVR